MAPTGSDWDWDANWLQVAGDVRDGDLAWQFEDPCMTTREARELADWLRRISLGQIEPDGQSGGGVLGFLEPNVHFELRARTATEATVVAFFSQESSPPGSGEDIRYGDGHEVVLVVSPEAAREAADDWERELAPFPER
jgi:hypothetical protein